MKPQYKKIRFLGLSLGGGKTHRTHLAVVDYFVDKDKVFLTHLFRDLGEENGVSGDTLLVDLIKKNSENLHSMSVDYPVIPPVCFGCPSKCHGVEVCKEEEVRWMWNFYNKLDVKKRPNKIFTPYSERAVDQWLSHEMEIPVPHDHALGSNRGPLFVRGQYLRKRLDKIKTFEVQPRMTVWRVGRALKISKTPLLFYKNSVDGEEHRQTFLDKLVDKEWLFIYSQDLKYMARDGFVFDAVMAAYTGFLNYKQLCEKPPKGFPKKAAWLLFPKEDFQTKL